MKKIFSAFALLNMACAFAQVQSPEYEWVKTGLWTAPQVRVMEGSITPESRASLQRNCREYDLRLKSLSLPEEKNLISHYRTRDLEELDGKFVTRFLINVPDMVVELGKTSNPEKLPAYVQTKATTRAFIEEESEIIFQADSGSFTALSREYQIPDSEYSFDFERGHQILTVYGKDVACDIFEGRAQFQIQAGSSVTLDSKNLKILQVFYMDKVQPVLNEVFNKESKVSSFIKAAKLGFKFGKLLSEINPENQKQTEAQIENLMNTLFQKDSLKFSSVVSESENEKKILVYPSIEGQKVTLTLSSSK